MLLMIWRFLTLVLVALGTGLSFAHLLELPARMLFEPQVWIAMTSRSLPHLFGTQGAVMEGAPAVATVILALLVRGRGTVGYLSAVGAACLVLALGLWLLVIAPVGIELANWTPGSYPVNWADYRNRWEHTHAFNAIIKIAGFSLLVLSILWEEPFRAEERAGSSAPAGRRERGEEHQGVST